MTNSVGLQDNLFDLSLSALSSLALITIEQ